MQDEKLVGIVRGGAGGTKQSDDCMVVRKREGIQTAEAGVVAPRKGPCLARKAVYATLLARAGRLSGRIAVARVHRVLKWRVGHSREDALCWIALDRYQTWSFPDGHARAVQNLDLGSALVLETLARGPFPFLFRAHLSRIFLARTRSAAPRT